MVATRPPTKAEQRAVTTAALLRAARRLFAARGYADVSLAEVVAEAGVTKGALYHYFGGKDELFQAVLAEVHREVADQVAAASESEDGWQRLIDGCRAFLAASTEPTVQRIMLVDAPSVLGWEVWRNLDAESSMQHLGEILERLMAEGIIDEQPVRPLAHLLSGAMNEAALWLARSDKGDRDRDLDDTMSALSRMLGALRT